MPLLRASSRFAYSAPARIVVCDNGFHEDTFAIRDLEDVIKTLQVKRVSRQSRNARLLVLASGNHRVYSCVCYRLKEVITKLRRTSGCLRRSCFYVFQSGKEKSQVV